jgi:hypothetical protein
MRCSRCSGPRSLRVDWIHQPRHDCVEVVDAHESGATAPPVAPLRIVRRRRRGPCPASGEARLSTTADLLRSECCTYRRAVLRAAQQTRNAGPDTGPNRRDRGGVCQGRIAQERQRVLRLHVVRGQHLGQDAGHWHPHMMVFSPYYENSMPGDNEFGKPLPFVTDDAGTPFAIARSSVLPLQQACLCGWKRLETPGLWLGSPRLALRLAPTRQRSTPIPVRPYSLCKDVLPSRRCEHFDPARHALGAPTQRASGPSSCSAACLVGAGSAHWLSGRSSESQFMMTTWHYYFDVAVILLCVLAVCIALAPFNNGVRAVFFFRTSRS